MDPQIKEIIKKANRKFDDVKDKDEFKKFFDADAHGEQMTNRIWFGPLRDKIIYIRNPEARASIKDIVDKLENNKEIRDTDYDKIKDFVGSIPSKIKVSSILSSIKNHPDLFDLFIAYQKADIFDTIDTRFRKPLQKGRNYSAGEHLFSIIKNCQNPAQYLIYYKYWKNIINKVLGGAIGNYADLCKFYKDFTTEINDRHLNFASYMSYIGESLINNLIREKVEISDNDYKELVAGDFFNLPELKEKIDNYRSSQMKETKPEVLAAVLESKPARKPLNVILFGPPGTGKTFNTINKALNILGIETENLQRESIKQQFDEHLKTGRIVFTTFHQNMSYEDFIEGIKPVTTDSGTISYKIIPGIFKKLCENAAAEGMVISNELGRSDKTFTEEDFDILYNDFMDRVPERNTEGAEINLQTPTGIGFGVFKHRNNGFFVKPEGANGSNISRKEVEKVFFGIKKANLTSYTPAIVEMLRQKFNVSLSYSDGSNNNYVLIIDEINRGNISQIFGELITLIEEDKRIAKDEEIQVTLPYSKESFSVPDNIYIIGTMNTADRSVEALDTALRRRFNFEEMPPVYDLLNNDTPFVNADLTDSLSFLGLHNPLSGILETINNRLNNLLDKDHLIGHSYLMNLESITELKSAFLYKIQPLLQEYFFNDHGKIGLVLGKGFVDKNTSGSNLAEFDYEGKDELESKVNYKLINIAKMEDNAFIEALGRLMSREPR